MLIRDKGLPFRSRAMFCNHGDSCSLLPAFFSHDPTPIALLLQTKAQPQFDSTVDWTVDVIFHVESISKSTDYYLSFAVFCCPVGRGSQAASCLPER
jgi:hypothetical protein